MKTNLIIAAAVFLTSFFWIVGNNVRYSMADKEVSCNTGFCVRVLTERYITGNEYSIAITRKDVPDYGLVIKYPESIISEDQLNPKVEWNDKGVKVTTKYGYEIFIAKEKYENGR